jgi:Rod binding domain-containing protein
MSQFGASGVAPVNQALEPAWVRNGSAATQQTYQTALAFEQMLLEQLSGALTQDGLEGEGEEASLSGEEGAPKLGGGLSSSLLTQALSQGLAAGGGLGVADELTRELQARESLTQGVAPTTTSPQPTVVTTSAGGSVSSASTGGAAA